MPQRARASLSRRQSHLHNKLARAVIERVVPVLVYKVLIGSDDGAARAPQVGGEQRRHEVGGHASRALREQESGSKCRRLVKGGPQKCGTHVGPLGPKGIVGILCIKVESGQVAYRPQVLQQPATASRRMDDPSAGRRRRHQGGRHCR
eukprot:scaffold8214_cov121-Isochrysis_galbana.AAC.6